MQNKLILVDDLRNIHVCIIYIAVSGSPSILARMDQPKGVNWTVIILTCQYKDSVQVFQRGR